MFPHIQKGHSIADIQPFTAVVNIKEVFRHLYNSKKGETTHILKSLSQKTQPPHTAKMQGVGDILLCTNLEKNIPQQLTKLRN